MKKFLVVISLVAVMSSSLMAKGGAGAFLASCCLGPRVGLEMNEGRSIRTMEWITLIPYVGYVSTILMAADAAGGKTMNEIRASEGLGGPTVKAVKPAQKGGVVPFLANCCLGPRIGLEMNDGRKVRNMELFQLIPFVGIIPRVLIAAEAGGGKTMTQVAAAEGLDK